MPSPRSSPPETSAASPDTPSPNTPGQSSVRLELLFYLGGLVLLGALTPHLLGDSSPFTVAGLLAFGLGSAAGVVGMWADGLNNVRGRATPTGKQIALVFGLCVLGQGLLQLVPGGVLAASIGFIGSLATVRMVQVATGQYP
ncbi:hypothetical protein SAMN04487949_2117 [Halogranum gelatinilyticum]|uniref:Uncharacterized protein n=1 Tax=Halogranum gelatinilyticum TaxID=660521 RepID=A0A1G9UAW6_9EURY|nr:hypothetical protein [Halogranum gelatinilyticum]SDM56992.1 hypothetical protein SAMN04487949_2117 [Halogranum gelatinilyticum]